MRKCILLLFLVACNDRRVAIVEPAPQMATHHYFDEALIKKADILFVIDDSSSMTTVQQNLITNFPVFINVLRSLPTGLPDLRIAVTTTSLGAGAFTGSVPGCGNNQNGAFINVGRADPTCSLGGQRWMDSTTIDKFACIAQVGADGCGFEHQLAAARAGIENSPDFVRADAYLAVIWITNEDDCSAPADSQLFDPSQNSISDPLGPLASFRCTEFGILCNGQKPPRQAAGPLVNCTSNENGPLTSVQSFIDFFQKAKPTGHFLPAIVAAPTDPFSVILDPQTGFPALAHSCTTPSNGTFGDPAVRMQQFAGAFGQSAVFTSICQDSYAAAMQVIAEKLKIALGNHCLSQRADTCDVEEVQYMSTPQQKPLGVVPACNAAGQASGTCYALIDDAGCMGSGQRIDVCRNGYNPASGCAAGPIMAPDSTTLVVECVAH